MHKFIILSLFLPGFIASSLADSLVGYWRMESTDGPTVVDSAPTGSSDDAGTWIGTANYSPAVFGNGIRLSGSNYLSIEDSEDTRRRRENLTVSVWCQVDSWDTGWQTVLAKGDSGSIYRIARYSSSSSAISYAGGNDDISGGSVNDGQWHHIVAVTEHNVETRLYVDGALVATNTDSPELSDRRPRNALLIGANPGASTLRQWKGGIDDVGLFDNAFTDTEVASLYALATDPKYLYDLGTFNELLKHHAAGAGGGSLEIGDDSWTYAASNPGPGADFFAFDESGSGLLGDPVNIESFSATPAYIAGGQSSLLEWDAAGFASLTLSGGLSPVDVTGLTSISVSPSATTAYTLTGSTSSAPVTATATVYVDTPPTVQLSANPGSIPSGGSTTLHWTSTGADTLEINEGIGNILPQTDASGSGFLLVENITTTTTYAITASNATSGVTDSVTITTGDPPVIHSFTIDEPNPVPESTIELAWSVSGADAVEISPNIGSVNPASGTASDTISSSTSYTLTAANSYGQVTAIATAIIVKGIGVDMDMWAVLQRSSSGTVTNLADADALLAGTNVLSEATATEVAEINYGPGNDGEFANDSAPPLGYGLDNFVLRATATLIVNIPGEYTFGINNDDGGRLRINGEDIIVDDARHAPTTSNGSIVLTAGNHSIEYVFFENTSGDAGEVFYINDQGLNSQLEVTGIQTPIATEDIIISEFMADNDITLDDAEGDSSDWIELYNGSGATINLTGYYLTDDESLPDKYAIPSFGLEHGGYLVLFASGKDTVFGGDEFHTNFKLSTNGEYLGLYKDDGTGGFEVVTEFHPAFPPQEEDASYGSWGNDRETGYMPTPTPGSLNFGGVQGFLGDTHFDVDRGLFYSTFYLTITADHPDATIRYTLDGSEPTTNSGGIYSEPLPISETTVVRAAAFLEDFAPTDVDTQTYIFPNDVPLQDQTHAVALGFPDASVNGQVYEYGMAGGSVTHQEVVTGLVDIPTISLVMEQDDFSSSATGIFSNAGKRGTGWQRTCSVELINENGLGTGQFQIECGVRIRGGASRSDNNPKHAFRFYFSNDYEGDLKYPVFQDEGPSQFEKLDLRTAQNYSWSFNNSDQNTFLREIHGRDAQREMGQPYTRSRYYQLYINGVYWGLFMSQERAEASYGETYFGGVDDDYDVIKSAASEANYTTEATDGDLNGAWFDLWSKVRALRDAPTDNAAYFAIQGLAADGLSPHADPANNPNLLDIDNLADYMLAIFYTGNFDAPLSTFVQSSNNWFAMRNRTGPDGFRFFVHDGEHSMAAGTGARVDDSDNRLGPWGDIYTDRPPSDFARSNPQYMHEDLAWNEEYRIAFADRVHKHFFNGGPFTEPQALARLDNRYQEITEAVRSELARWGDGFNYNTWLAARQAVINFINAGVSQQTSGIGRRAYIIDLLRNYEHDGSKPLYPLIDAPVYSVNGGSVVFGFELQVSNPNASGGTIYYTLDGSDPRLVGGSINSTALTSGTVALTQSGRVKARVYDAVTSTWSAANDFEFIVGIAGSAGNLVVSEVHYNPASTPADSSLNKDDYEFIELLNLSDTDTLELTGTTFVAGITFDFTDSNVIQLAPGARVVVVSNLDAFTERYPDVPASAIAGAYTGNLDNSGERITLMDSTTSVIKDFTYDDRLPWPTAADGDGYSMVLNIETCNPEHNASANWRSHGTLHGNPAGPDGTTWNVWASGHGLSGILGTDTDRDTVSDLFEYASGTDPNAPASEKPSAFGFASYYVDGAFQEFPTITVRRNLDATDILYFPQVSSDLATWSSSDNDLIMVEAVNQGDGTELVTWRSAQPTSHPGQKQLYIRLIAEVK